MPHGQIDNLKCVATSILAGIGTPAKKIYMFAWLVKNKGDPKKARNEKGELILGNNLGFPCCLNSKCGAAALGCQSQKPDQLDLYSGVSRSCLVHC